MTDFDSINQDDHDRVVFQSILETDGLHLLVLEYASVVVETTYLNIIPNITHKASPYAIIENVVTERTERGKGFGKALMAHTLDFAWERGCYKAMLFTGSERQATHAFYRSCGFTDSDKRGYVVRPPMHLARNVD